MTAGSEIANGAASSLTDRSGAAASRITSARRVGSASAAKVRSSAAGESFTMWLSIEAMAALSTAFVVEELSEATRHSGAERSEEPGIHNHGL